MITVRDIYKSYGSVKVLKGICMDVGPGEIVSVVGASGAGKSTLLHLIGSLDIPDSGTIDIGEVRLKDLAERKLAAYRNMHIGFVFQFHHLLPEFTALENVCIPALIGKKDKRHAMKAAMELLEFMGLKERMHHKPMEMSGGEQQRVAVARALINKPHVVLADEPSGNLDSASARDLHKLFFSLRDTFKQTYIIVTHNTELASMTDRTLTIRDGQID